MINIFNNFITSPPQKSIVVCWDHSNMPNILKYLGCTNDICLAKLLKFEFDEYFKLTLSCFNSEIIKVEKLNEECTDGFQPYKNYK